ncbi:hypothetical protein SK3146_00597 [Paenibacillus konkukensis]|uniref:Uncharacterized protein n=1 Tax=Paenibacillus konkukensis TaxID=2020716 RepID=A0ABY4RG36_9BACL|nr:hypothetical protein [Paenibacillus konkukensis]UQZ81441.1 hypothetical protein SK3146_00597 [Paenibacillus konkukensis]
MRTRLLSEQLIRTRFPHILYCRVHTNGRHKATIYAWNEDLQLTETEMRKLKQFASDYLNPSLCFQVKAYHMVQEDNVPQAKELPDPFRTAALKGNLDQEAIIDTMNTFADGHIRFNDYDPEQAVVHFDYYGLSPVQPDDQTRMTEYLNELLPIGSLCEIAFHLTSE